MYPYVKATLLPGGDLRPSRDRFFSNLTPSPPSRVGEGKLREDPGPNSPLPSQGRDVEGLRARIRGKSPISSFPG